jgi:peptidoglycan-associated lipoprotein
MTMRHTLLIAIISMAVGLSIGCGKRRIVPPAPPTPQAAVEPAPPAPPPPPSDPVPEPPAVESEEEAFQRKTLDQLNAEQPLKTVLFDYDSSTLTDEARDTLQTNAQWLQRWTTTRVVAEGHCDARGTAEYNLGLGERRATAVRGYLLSLGVGPDRVTAVSKGKEQPVCDDAHEGCWRQNRRGHFVITAK